MTDALKSSATKHWLLENLKEMHIPAEHISTLVAAASSSAAVHHHGEGAAAPVKEEGGVPRDVASGGNDDGGLCLDNRPHKRPKTAPGVFEADC